MNNYINEEGHLMHYGVPGMKKGVRRFVDAMGRLTSAGRARYGKLKRSRVGRKARYVAGNARAAAVRAKRGAKTLGYRVRNKAGILRNKADKAIGNAALKIKLKAAALKLYGRSAARKIKQLASKLHGKYVERRNKKVSAKNRATSEAARVSQYKAKQKARSDANRANAEKARAKKTIRAKNKQRFETDRNRQKERSNRAAAEKARAKRIAAERTARRIEGQRKAESRRRKYGPSRPKTYG